MNNAKKSRGHGHGHGNGHQHRGWDKHSRRARHPTWRRWNPNSEPWSDVDTEAIAAMESDELNARRPNRWRSTSWRWLYRTIPDRMLLPTLKRMRKKNLAIHLYNAFALRHPWMRKRKSVAKKEKVREKEGEKERDMEGEKDKDGRKDGEKENERETDRAQEKDDERDNRHDGDEIDDEEYRDNDEDGDDEEDDGDTQNKSKSNDKSESESHHDDTSNHPFVPTDRWSTWPKRMRLDKKDGLQDGWDWGGYTTITEIRPPKTTAVGNHISAPLEEALTAMVLRRANERVHARGDSVWARKARPHKRRGFAMTSDDAWSSQLLRPPVRHVITQMDRTLLVLHNSRMAGLRVAASRVDASDTRGAGAGATTEQDPWARGRLHKRKAPRPLPPATTADLTAHQAGTLARLRPRDWRDVLGSAALAGVDSSVLARAAQRCANLFGETMTLETLDDGEAGGPLRRHTRTTYKPGGTVEARVKSEEESEEEGEEEEEETEQEGEDKGAVDRLEDETPSTAVQGADDADIRDTPHRPRKVVYLPPRKIEGELMPCPVAGCPRAAKGFARRTNLVRHLATMHYTTVSSMPPAADDARSARAGTPRKSAVYLPSNAPLVCPVADCPRSTTVFARRYNLVRHVGLAHYATVTDEPEV